jgi:predicted molibdopterin-dependent oxidoreductase YjgC
MCPTVSFVQDNTLLKIDGRLLGNGDRPDHGQLCRKGRFEPMKSAGMRLLQPLVRREDGSWAAQTWEKALGLVAERLNSIRDAYGGMAIFGLASSRCSNEELMLFRDLMEIGWAAEDLDTLDGAHFRTIFRAREKMEEPFKEASWKRIPKSDFILLVGADPHQSQPVVSSMIRKVILEKGAKLAVIGHKDSMHPWTSFYLPAKKGDEPLLIESFWAEAVASMKTSPHILNGKSFPEDPAKVGVSDLVKRADLNGDAKTAFYEVAKLLANSRNPLMIAGEGLTGLDDPSGMKDLMNLALLKGLLPKNGLRLIILKPNGNSAGAWRLGLSSRKEIHGKGRWRGGMIILGGEDVSDSGRLDLLSGMDFLAVLSPYFPETLADKAHVLIPKPLWMEEDGSYTSLDGIGIGYKKRVLHPPEGVKESWQTMVDLAHRTKFRPDFKTWSDLSKKADKEMKLSDPLKGMT